MAIVRRDRFGFEFPERWRRLFDADFDTGWLRVEEFQDKDELVVRAEMPGIDPEKDVEVTVSSGMLHIRAHREEKSEEQDKAHYRSEFRYGEFVRDIAMPAGVKEDDVKATYADGILEVRVPWPEAEKPSTTRVPISKK